MDLQMNKTISFKDFQERMMKWLVIGIGITALTSLIINLFHIIDILSFMLFPVMIIFSIIEIIMVIILLKKISNLSFNTAKIYFYIYSIINGITMSFLLSMVSPGVSALAFLMTCAYFGLLYTIAKYSQSEFIGLGKICISALPILVITYLILIFIEAPILHYIVVFADLAIFTGITLYDMKKVKRMYEEANLEELECAALLCALELYLDFINIFIDIIMLIADNN